MGAEWWNGVGVRVVTLGLVLWKASLRPRYLNEIKKAESSQFGENLRIKYSRWKKQQI